MRLENHQKSKSRLSKTYLFDLGIILTILFRFEANFGAQTVTFTFKCMGLPEVQAGQIRVLRKGNKMEVQV